MIDAWFYDYSDIILCGISDLKSKILFSYSVKCPLANYQFFEPVGLDQVVECVNNHIIKIAQIQNYSPHTDSDISALKVLSVA